MIDQPPFTNQCGELPTLKVALRFPVAYGFFSWHCDRRYIHNKTTPGSSQGITRIYKNEQHAEDTIKKRCQNLLVPQRVRNLEPHPGWHLPAQRRSSRPNKNGAGCASWKEYLKFRTASPQSILLSLNKGLAIPSHAWEIEKITYLIAARVNAIFNETPSWTGLKCRTFPCHVGLPTKSGWKAVDSGDSRAAF